LKVMPYAVLHSSSEKSSFLQRDIMHNCSVCYGNGVRLSVIFSVNHIRSLSAKWLNIQSNILLPITGGTGSKAKLVDL